MMPSPFEQGGAAMAPEQQWADAVRLHEAGQFEAARAAYQAILASTPDHVDALGNLGVVYRRLDQPAQAMACLEQAVQLAPGHAQHLYNYGNALREARQFGPAIAAYARAVAAAPRFAAAHYNLGLCQEALDQMDAAVVCYRNAIAADPSYYVAYLNLGSAFQERGQLARAAETYLAAAAIAPGQPHAYNNLALVEQRRGRIDQAIHYGSTALKLAPGNHMIASNFQLSLQYHADISDEQLLRMARSFGARFPVAPPLPRRPLAGRRLRLGYVSGDFAQHPVGHFLRAVIPNHRQVDVFCYANSHYRDQVTEELAACVSWRNIADADDAAVCQQIAADGIDVLVDLSGHTAGNRLGVFSMRAAPLQLSWLGYFATTGLATMDAVLMDRHHVPESLADAFTERVLYLPSTRFCYTPPKQAPDVAPLPALRRGHVTFGSFNNTAKLNDAVLQAWSAILRTVPDARLVLKCRNLADPDYRAVLRARFADLGIAAGRIELREHSPHADMLAQYGDIDIALDPFPFTGGLTSCEALWMGVPMVTLFGTRAVSRQSLCILENLDLAHLATDDAARYVTTAVELAAGLDDLSALRASLRERMLQSPLMDGPGFAQALEQLLMKEWSRIDCGN